MVTDCVSILKYWNIPLCQQCNEHLSTITSVVLRIILGCTFVTNIGVFWYLNLIPFLRFAHVWHGVIIKAHVPGSRVRVLGDDA